MEENTPKGIAEFPLTEMTARYIVNDLAENFTSRIRWSKHVKQRMLERGVTSRQILTLRVGGSTKEPPRLSEFGACYSLGRVGVEHVSL